MKTIRILGHPVHRMLIAFPMGLLGTAAIFKKFGVRLLEPQTLKNEFGVRVV
jgi:uncharacterized membrane protein